jgi:hypothetical protein
MIIPVQNEKALFLQCHKVVIIVKHIYGIDTGNDDKKVDFRGATIFTSVNIST